MSRILFVLATLLVLASCRKKNEVDPVPVLTFESISETEVTQFENTLTVVLGYTDADGDLGQSDPDDLSLRVRDDRLEDYDWYHIPPLTPNQ